MFNSFASFNLTKQSQQINRVTIQWTANDRRKKQFKLKRRQRSTARSIVVVDWPLHQSPAKEPQAAKKKIESTRVAGDLLATASEAVAGVAFDPPSVFGGDTEDGVAGA